MPKTKDETTTGPRCPKCGKSDQLSSVERTIIHYPIVLDADEESGWRYPGESSEVFDECSEHEGTFNCGRCSEDFDWPDETIGRRQPPSWLSGNEWRAIRTPAAELDALSETAEGRLVVHSDLEALGMTAIFRARYLRHRTVDAMSHERAAKLANDVIEQVAKALGFTYPKKQRVPL